MVHVLDIEAEFSFFLKKKKGFGRMKGLSVGWWGAWVMDVFVFYLC